MDINSNNKYNDIINKLHLNLYHEFRTNNTSSSSSKHETSVAHQYTELQLHQLSYYIRLPVVLFKSIVPIRDTQSNKLYKQYNDVNTTIMQRVVYLTTQYDTYANAINDGKLLLNKCNMNTVNTINTVQTNIALLRKCMLLSHVNILLQLLHLYKQICDNYVHTVHQSLVLLKHNLANIQSCMDELSGLNDTTNYAPELKHTVFYTPPQLLLYDDSVQELCSERILLEEQYHNLVSQYNAVNKQTYKLDHADKYKRMNSLLTRLHSFTTLHNKHTRECTIELEFSCMILDERYKLGAMLAEWINSIEQYDITDGNYMDVHSMIHTFLIRLYRCIVADYKIKSEHRDPIKIILYRILFSLLHQVINKLILVDSDINNYSTKLSEQLQSMNDYTIEQLGVPIHFTPVHKTNTNNHQSDNNCTCQCHTVPNDVVDAVKNDRELSLDISSTQQSTAAAASKSPLHSLTSRIMNYFTPVKLPSNQLNANDISSTAPPSRITSPNNISSINNSTAPIKHRYRSYTDQSAPKSHTRRNSEPNVLYSTPSSMKRRESMWDLDKWLTDFNELNLTSTSYTVPLSSTVHDDTLTLLLRKTTISPSMSTITMNHWKSDTANDKQSICCTCGTIIQPSTIRAYSTAIDSMNELCRLHSPIDMLNCLLHICKLIYDTARDYAVQHTHDTINLTADSLFPIMCYIVLQCNNSNIMKQIKLMQLYTCNDYLQLQSQQSPSLNDTINNDKLLPSLSESAYYLTLLDSVTLYIVSYRNNQPSQSTDQYSG